MPAPRLVVAGLILTFGRPDATELNLTVALTEPQAVSLQWGPHTRTSSAASLHTFGGLPTPRASDPARGVEYVLKAGDQVIARRIPAMRGYGPLRLGLVGDGGPGAGPRRAIIQRLRSADVDAVVAVGDPFGWSSAESGPADPGRRLDAMPLTTRRPVIVAGARAGGVPPVDDPVRARWGLPPHVHHLRLGSTLVWVLDPGLGFNAGGAQARFVRAVIDAHPQARWRVVVVPQGPMSSGPSGPRRWAGTMRSLVDATAIDVVLSGQDRLYERLVQDRTTYVVSGASGGAFDRRRWVTDETRALVGAPHWVRLTLDEKTGTVEAFGIEGAVLDRAEVPEPTTAAPGPVPWGAVFGAFGLLAAGFIAVAVDLLRPKRGPG